MTDLDTTTSTDSPFARERLIIAAMVLLFEPILATVSEAIHRGLGLR
jgi:hypothetical protein